MAGARELKKPKGNKNPALIAAGIILAVLVGGYLGLCAWLGQGDIYPNVTVGGLDVSGLWVEQAQDVVDEALAQHGGKASVTLTYGDWSGTMTGDRLHTFGKGSPVNAWEVGRESFLTRGFHYIRHLLGGGADMELNLCPEGVNQPELEQLLDEAQRHVTGDFHSESYKIEGDQLVMTKGVTAVSLLREEAKLMVYDAFEQQALPAAFRGESANVTLQLPVAEQPPEEPEFEQLHAQLCSEVKEPALNPETMEVSAHSVGLDFDVAQAKALYAQTAEGGQFTVPLTVIQPKDTKESYESKLFADLLGEATSRVGGTANRKENVRLSAAACNEVILMPGDIFAYNETTGSRTADKGYLPAPIYSGGLSVDDVGGGICQTSSTIYLAVLYTPLEVVERHPHMYAPGYVPDGMDATVFYGYQDFRFKNSTNYPLKIVTESYDKNGSRYLKVKLYGTDEDGRYGVPERIQFDWVTPTVKYVPDETVPRGTTKEDEKQNPYTGVSAQAYRYIYEKDGTLVEKQDMGLSKYKMRPTTLYYNPLDGDPETWVNGQPPQSGSTGTTPPPGTIHIPTVPENPVQPEPSAPEEDELVYDPVPVLPSEPEGAVDVENWPSAFKPTPVVE